MLATQAPAMAVETDPAESISGDTAVFAAGNGIIISWNAPEILAEKLSLSFDGKPLRAASAILRAERSDGGIRILLGFRPPATHGILSLNGEGDHCLRQFGLDRRVVDLPGGDSLHPGRLVNRLTPGGRARLLGFLLQFCAGQLKADADPGFRALCLGVVTANGLLQPMQIRYRATSRHLLAEGPALPVGQPSSVHLLNREMLRRLDFLPRMGGETRGGGTWLALPPGCTDRTVAVIIGDAGIASCPIIGQTQAPPSLASAACARFTSRAPQPPASPQAVSYTLALAAAHPEDAELATLGRELQFLLPAEPVALRDAGLPIRGAVESLANAAEAGVFLSGWIEDRHGLIDGVELVSPFGTRHEVAILHRFAKAASPSSGAGPGSFGESMPETGFVARVADAATANQYRLELRLHSGTRIPLVSPASPSDPALARAAVLGSVPPVLVTPAMMESCIAPAAAALHAELLRRRGIRSDHWIGEAPEAPAISVIVPLYRNLAFIPFQLAALAADPEMRDAELIYSLDSPEQAEELALILRGLYQIYALPMRLLVQRVNLGFAPNCNAAAALARGKNLLFLNSDVIPAEAGWMGKLHAALAAEREAGVAGPKLLFADDSLQHAGLTFGRNAEGLWFNRHFFKGYPRDYAPAVRKRPVPAVTGACVMIAKALFDRISGFSEDYIIGDYEDSDLCLKVRQEGGQAVYLPGAELYHLERQSIVTHSGYSRGVACLYNQRLHHGRWAEDIARLMRAGAA